MGFLTGVEIRRRFDANEIEIYSTVEEEEFSADSQITEDSVDLRLSPLALQSSPELNDLDYLDPNLSSRYSAFRIPDDGYELQPLEVVIGQTLEMICLPAHLMGLVVTRSTFARLGIMVNLGAPKFAAGIHWCFPLQLFNCSGKKIRIYPYAPVAQLLISDMVGDPVGYRGRYQDTAKPLPPLVSDRERETLTSRNPAATFRTKHIVKRASERRSPEIFDTNDSTHSYSSPSPPPLAAEVESVMADHRALVLQLHRLTRALKWSLFCAVEVVVATVIASSMTLYFRDNEPNFWVVLSSVVVGLVLFFGVGLALIFRLKLHAERLAKVWKSLFGTIWGWLGAAVVALILTFGFAPPPGK